MNYSNELLNNSILCLFSIRFLYGLILYCNCIRIEAILILPRKLLELFQNVNAESTANYFFLISIPNKLLNSILDLVTHIITNPKLLEFNLIFQFIIIIELCLF